MTEGNLQILISYYSRIPFYNLNISTFFSCETYVKKNNLEKEDGHRRVYFLATVYFSVALCFFALGLPDRSLKTTYCHPRGEKIQYTWRNIEGAVLSV
jgi:hypothetical protein